MMLETGLLIGFFGLVLTGVLLAGAALARRQPDGGSFTLGAVRSLGALVPSANTGRSVRRLLNAAGYRQPEASSVFSGIASLLAACVSVTAGVAALWMQDDPTYALVGAVAGAGFGFLIPNRILESLVKRRQKRLRQALPAALDLLVLTLESGQGLDLAMLETGREIRASFPDLADEFNTMHLSLRAGRSRAEVFRDFTDRNPEAEVRRFAGLFLDCDRYGSSVGPALRNHARYLRIRRRQQAQESARKVSVKLVFPVFFLIFPCVLLVTLAPAAIRLMNSLQPMLAK